MMGVFVQTNTDSHMALVRPVGYVIEESGCWQWVGVIERDGYGRAEVPRPQRRAMAHRLVYEREVGPIPEGLTLDHLCRNRACVNPAHLEPVTMRTNTLRGDAVSAVQARQTHCIHGHPFCGDNLILYTPPGKARARRCCRECHRTRSRLRYARQKAARLDPAAILDTLKGDG